MENIVRIVGTVGEVAEKQGFIQILTTALSRGRKFVTKHAVKIDTFNAKTMVKGKKLDIKGELIQHGKRTVVSANTVTPVAKNAEFVNLAKISGESVRKYEFFPSRPGNPPKQAMGNLLLRVGENMLARAKLWNHTAYEFNPCPAGSEAIVIGRINYRSDKRIDPQTGEESVLRLTEVVASPDQTKLLKRAEVLDPFTGKPITGQQSEETPAATEDDGIPF